MSEVSPIETGIPDNRQRDHTSNSVTVTVTEFMSAVVPWPVDNIGHVNLHYSMTNPKAGEPLLKGMGWPFKNLNSFIQRAAWITNSINFKDVWFCTSRQRDAAINSKGKPKALRRHNNVMDLKAIWIDADVKPDDTSGKHYTSMGEAWAALCAFRRKVGLPDFSAAVNSGGGLHVYWISERALEPAAWSPYAAGLKALLLKEGVLCDAGLTTDNVRLLRVPGTYNHKYDPPREVELLPLPLAKYDFETSLVFLTTVVPAPVASTTSSNKFQGVNPLAVPMANDSLSDGIEKREDIILDPRPVFQQCAFMRNAFAKGGADLDNPLWNLSVLATTFMENGNDYAHAISKKHETYSPSDTQALYDRKIAERADRGIGYPSCAAIAGNGCKLCAACSHFPKGKSPLNLTAPVVTATVTKQEGSRTNQAELNPVAALMKLSDQGAELEALLSAMNEAFAVVKYGSKIAVASFVGKDLDFMKVEDFHNMLANLVGHKQTEIRGDSGAAQTTTQVIVVSRYWFKWPQRRQYVGRGAVFEPGGALAVSDDMLNMWRGFGVEPKQGDWSLMRVHIRDIICWGNEEHFAYLIKWMAYGVQHPDRPIGVAIALRGEEGTGKGFVWRNYGKLFGRHFRHVAQGDHLTGRFNAVLAETCAVFLDEALWAGDRKGEQILKALITEETFQLERKNYDPIPVKNRLRLMIASNNEWIVPVGTKGRRYVVLDVNDKYADAGSQEHNAYWEKLQEQFGDDAPDDGRSAMLFDLLHMDLTGFNVRAVPNSAAKTEQKLLSLKGAKAWLCSVLQDGAIGHEQWNDVGLTVTKGQAYAHYEAFSKQRREWQPETKDMWSKALHAALGAMVADTRPTVGSARVRSLRFGPLADCRARFAGRLGDPEMEWETENEQDNRPEYVPAGNHQDREDDLPDVLGLEWEPELEPAENEAEFAPDQT
jgi:hypothetical protein